MQYIEFVAWHMDGVNNALLFYSSISPFLFWNGRGRVLITVLLHFYSPSPFAYASWPCANSSAECAARPSDRHLLAVCSFICDPTSLLLSPSSQTPSWLSSCLLQTPWVSVGEMLIRETRPAICGATGTAGAAAVQFFLADGRRRNYEWGNLPQPWLLFCIAG